MWEGEANKWMGNNSKTTGTEMMSGLFTPKFHAMYKQLNNS